MNFTTKVTIAAAAAVVAVPASAQRAPVGGSYNNPNASSEAKPQGLPQNIPGSTAPTSTTGRKFVVSPKAQKPILELQTAVNANDVANIPAKLAAAQAVAKSSDEKYLVASNQTTAALKAGDLAGIRAGVDALQASGGADAADLATRYTDLGKRYQQAKQMNEADAAYTKALSLNANSPSALALLAGIRNDQGKKAEAVALMQRSFIASKALGQKVAEGNYKFATGLAYGQRLPLANQMALEWLTAYPSPVAWRDSILMYRDLNKPSGTQLVDMMRLARAAQALRGESDYFAMGSALVSAGKLGEARSLLAEARTAPNVDSTKRAFTDLSAQVAKAPARAAIDASAKAALAGSSGPAMIAAGDALYGAGAYADAAPLYRAALAKGGDASLANLHLGMALAQSGDKAGAVAALNAVTGANAEVAHYWLLWASSRS